MRLARPGRRSLLLVGALAALSLLAYRQGDLRATAAAVGLPLQFPSQAGTLVVSELARGLEQPWSLAFLPDGSLLVSERPGRLRLVSREGRIGAPISGVPAVHARGQGGLLDVALMPDFSASGGVCFSYAEPRGEDASATAVACGRLDRATASLRELRVIYRQEPALADSDNHYGSRLAFAPDGTLFVTLGERYSGREQAQTLDNGLGKVVRLRPDGGIPADNPFVGRAGVRPEIWSYGHRNPQGAAIHPQTGALWITEHGPKGGDELNRVLPGRNYGWPVITYGREYSGLKVGDGLSQKEGMEQPQHYWVPSIATSGLAFYTADRIPAWKGSAFVASLKFGQLARLSLDGDKVVAEERLLEGLNRRLRDVRQGPDGALYLLTDETNGAILRLDLLKP
ncbi:PQQ-dependent sugar dehydrogenase [Stagnimonas aquatica]|uniref:PQQ-dependent sugar dehydrogenase n=1 Tax=Stagnimonas aquatica TaxID=2689987 RepID=A0A3N0VND7_9GAMM|nr:PQQ-dependent sugar dehydrogenase [Stagnimonas aquatica]ROH93498.1 PQQ-dependent sugar dehydrogenase [Stagnimonas aquatica]